MDRKFIFLVLGMFILILAFAGEVNAGCIPSETDDCTLGTFYGLDSHTCRSCSINHHYGASEVMISVEQTCLGYKFSGAFQCDPDNQYGCEVNTNLGTFVAPESEADNYPYNDETVDGFDATITDPEIGDSQIVTIPPMGPIYLSVINGNEPEKGDPLTVFSNLRIDSDCGPLDDFYTLSHDVTLLSGGEEIPLGDNIGVIANKLNSTQLQKLIDEIGQGSETHFRVKIGGKRNIDLGVKLSNCYHLSGDGENVIEFLIGESTGWNLQKIMDETKRVVDYEFYKTEPFKTYSNKFNFFVDLNKKKDLSWSTTNDTFGSRFFEESDLSSSCSSSFSEKIFLHDRKDVHPGYASFGKRIAVVRAENIPFYGRTVMHETGHAFAGLNDEYFFDNTLSNNVQLGKNCFEDPEYFAFGHYLYADPKVGCSYGTKMGLDLDHARPIYRPSEDSIMRCTDSRFNVFSCGRILMHMGVAFPFAMCMSMDDFYVIKPDCTKTGCRIAGFSCDSKTKLCKDS